VKLNKTHTNIDESNKGEDIPPSHYYMDGERLVFTEQYHIDRGYCCGNNCRHCAFEPKAQKGNTTIFINNG
jgi:hypothetical protein